MKFSLTKIIVFLIISTLVPLILAFKEPISFQKLNSIVELSIENNLVVEKSFDVERLISGIPYKTESSSIPYSLPSDRFNQSILDGTGNCADFSFGAAFWLRSKEIDYEVLHFLPINNFLEGQGHTIVRSSFELDGTKEVGLIDFLYGGLITNNDRTLDVTDITAIVSQGNPDKIAIRSLSTYHNDESLEIAVDLSLKKYVVGRLLGDDINRYFSFVEFIHFKFGHRYLEKLFVDGVALLMGVYPKIYVDPNENLLSGLQYKKFIYSTCLWALRLLALLWLVFLITCIFKMIHNGIKEKFDGSKK
jgi:hypothetical protein